MEEKKQENKKKNIINLIIEIILIIIIILLLLHSCNLHRIAEEAKKKKIPTGNVDVIEIKCDASGKCEKSDNDGSNNTLPIINPTNSDEPEEPVEDLIGFVVEDDYTITWNGSKDLKIFANPAYEFQEKIAPESSNTYKFVVKNTTDMKVKYSISFVETNPYNINLKYKLKREDEYLIDKYVSSKNVSVTDQPLNGNSEDTYYLDWKWISSNHDTEAGKVQANYKLKIEVKAESINE